MKKKLYSIITCAMLVTSTLPVHATGYPVFDISGWLTAIDQLYQQYDMVMNTITQIENQYQQIQQAVERAKSIDWDNIRFDGDFDIRNDIKDANKRVNKLLNQARQIKNTLTTPNIDCGNGRYSLADLCGMGSPDHNFFSACKDVESYMTDSMKFSIDAIEGNLTEKQKMMIWKKYGISPKNYLFVQQSVAQVKTQASKLMAKATDEAVQLQREEKIAKTNAIIQAAYAQTDSNGNMTEAAANEASLYLSQQVVDGLMSLEEAIEFLAEDELLEVTPENFRITALQSKSLRKFFKKDCVNQKTGEIMNSSDIKAFIDFDKVAEYRKSMGYYQIVTSELTMDPLEVIDKYHGLTQIEDQFRVMKGDLDTRPFFVRTPEHINAHLLICMIALILMRIIQKRIIGSGLIHVDEDAYWSTGLNGKRIQTALNKWKVDILPGDLYRFMSVNDPDLKLILDAFDIKIPAKLYRRSELKSIKTDTKIFI